MGLFSPCVTLLAGLDLAADVEARHEDLYRAGLFIEEDLKN